MYCEEIKCKNYISHHATIGDTVEWAIVCRICPNPNNEFYLAIAYSKILERCKGRSPQNGGLVT